MTSDFMMRLKPKKSEKELQTERELDAYRSFISGNLPGYLMFVEAINQTITQLEKDNIIGPTKLRCRLKAAGSALINTRKKGLDDIFGIEIVTKNERDKEFLMLIVHNIFERKLTVEKNYNKSNGYCAHHCTGHVKKKIRVDETGSLEEHIMTSQTIQLKDEYKDLPKKDQQKMSKKDLFKKVVRYPTLRQEILENGGIQGKLQEDFEKALMFVDEYLNGYGISRGKIPVIECQFKTIEVEREAVFGRAQHVNYKKVNEEKIKQRYNRRQLIRGIDFPFVFVRNNKREIELESTNKTLIHMWPFLKETIAEYKKKHKIPLRSYDMYLAKVFPSLEQYVIGLSLKEPCLPVINLNADGIWNIIKRKIINNEFYLAEYDEPNIEKKEGKSDL